MRRHTRVCPMVCCVWMTLALCSDADVVRSGWIPNRMIPQGQVQVVRAENGFRVDILLHTRHMDRVVKAIIEKETGNWPTNHPDAIAYMEMITLAREDIRKISPDHEKETLMISFRLNQHESLVVWATGTIEKTKDNHLFMPDPTITRSWMASRSYLRTNAELILEDSLGMSRDEARHLLAELCDE